jgi:hypothetical protein
MRTAAPVPFNQLTAVFSDIERERNWEPSFPARYIQVDTTPWKEVPTASTIVAGTTTTEVSTLSGASGMAGSHSGHANSTTTGAPPRNTMVRNIAYRAASFEDYKAMGIRIGRLKESLKDRNVKIPTNASNVQMCLAYHILGYCNEPCNSARDHAPHTDREDKDLAAWCKEHLKME